MFSAKVIQEMRQNNISVDADKTKSRISALWKTTPKNQREEILFLAGLKKSAVERSYKTGNVSIKIVVALAQTLGVNPFYLTGETDEENNYSDEVLKEILIQHDYQYLVKVQEKEDKAKQRKVNKQALVEEEIENSVPENPSANIPPVEIPTDNAVFKETEEIIQQPPAAPSDDIHLNIHIPSEMKETLNDLTEDDIILLTKAMLLKARASDENAAKAFALKMLLIM